jgi:hypothetical protein
MKPPTPETVVGKIDKRSRNEFFDYISVRAFRDVWSEHVEFALVHRACGRPVEVCTELKFTPVNEGERLTPTFKLAEMEAQELMDMLWACGLRPTQSGESVGQLEAVERHLADFRQLLSHQLGVPLK